MNNAEKKTILVTGGAGYIGSHTCKILAQEGYRPVAFDNLSSGHTWAAKWGPLERGDILDRAALDQAIEKHRPSACLHFAAFAYVGESVTDPGKYYRNNVVGSLTLLEALRDHGIDQFVLSSTCATYGVPDKVPIDETLTQAPINPYGASKLMVERMLADFYAAYRLRSVALRYFNAAGADPEVEIGEDHDPETHLVPLVLDAASGDREDITVFGTDYDTPDGTCVRDYIHVSDLARAHVLALQALEQGQTHRAFNLGNGQGYSVREVIASVERVTGRPVPVQFGERRPGDPARLISNSVRAASELGWKPQISTLDDIVFTAWEWHKRRAQEKSRRSFPSPSDS
ncbi:UDP-glucose 4-epimerase GalE [Bradyrhizobium erythrophlei]|uniref:UDP-glucose 4-epimerase n=1 Tax=Bradyrhizobium erythrophlei TaxID=1437360 RepID=A0A1M7SQM0_9BRAD|nr:UDP-glucose 4-epimerase GalE [Bradyrhizobium erythrophlei]SHN60700.1 UDP-arabinose 4-epimerase [Bradyrhizobium erythrophlei]